ncbi:MAG: hypothetical protein AB7F28_05690 [Candidatus Margulisiibacteriota bacterium]
MMENIGLMVFAGGFIALVIALVFRSIVDILANRSILKQMEKDAAEAEVRSRENLMKLQKTQREFLGSLQKLDADIRNRLQEIRDTETPESPNASDTNA